MSDLDELMKIIPTGDIAKQLGIPESVADAAVQQVLPGLVGGLAANAQSPQGKASLEKAVVHHQGKAVKGGKASLKDVDTKDGEKIVGHVFGAKTDQVATTLAANSSAGDVTGEIIKQVLPIVAPIVLSWLASKFLGGSTTTAAPKEEPASSGGIGDVLGGLLSSKQGQDMLGGVLGGLLGGK
ncbi:MAG: DUF937 domain-containing protein [Actinomycetales bacterium]|nr:DUF937 domain-containing protein [Actinomycetales bacterium]